MDVFKVCNVTTGEFKDRKGFSKVGRVYSSRKAAACALTKTVYHNGSLAGKLTVMPFVVVAKEIEAGSNE